MLRVALWDSHFTQRGRAWKAFQSLYRVIMRLGFWILCFDPRIKALHMGL
jgi:hypothetical protein